MDKRPRSNARLMPLACASPQCDMSIELRSVGRSPQVPPLAAGLMLSTQAVHSSACVAIDTEVCHARMHHPTSSCAGMAVWNPRSAWEIWSNRLGRCSLCSRFLHVPLASRTLHRTQVVSTYLPYLHNHHLTVCTAQACTMCRASHGCYSRTNYVQTRFS